MGARPSTERIAMSNPTEERRDQARRKAQNHFAASEQRDALVRKEIEKERATSAAKTAKLRALRLAKEASEKEAAQKLEMQKPEVKARKGRTSRSKRAPGY
jgi:hypothetical protein